VGTERYGDGRRNQGLGLRSEVLVEKPMIFDGNGKIQEEEA